MTKMRRIRASLLRLVGLFGGKHGEDQLADEIKSHLEMHVEDNIRAGMTPDEARRVALVRLGGVESSKEHYRDQRGLPCLDTLARDLRYAARTLRKSPGFSAAAVFTLALGIGANTAIFSVINGVLLRPLGFKDPNRLVRVWEKGNGIDRMALAYPNFIDWKGQNKSLDDMAAFRDTAYSLTGFDSPERLSARQVTYNFLSVLGAAPLVGRDFTPDDDRAGANLVTIISDALWAKRFGRAQSALGETITLNDERYTIVGVLRSDFHFYSESGVFTALNAKKDPYLETRSIHPGIQAVARLRSGVSSAQAAADLAEIARRLGGQYPDTNKDHSATVASLFDDIVGDSRRLLLTLLAAVGFVLLIACANVASLMLARSSARQKEVAIRAALGASRFRIVRMLLAESMLLAGAGGGFGLVLAFWGTGFALKTLPGVLPRAAEIGVDSRVLLFTLAASILTGAMFGSIPALLSTKSDLNDTLKEGGRAEAGSKPWVRSVLVITEIAMAVVLLAGSGLLIRSIANLRQVDPGFDPKNVMSFRVSLSPGAFPDAARIRAFYRDFPDRMSRLPGVQAVAATSIAPLNGFGYGFPFYVTGRPVPASGDLPVAMSYLTTSDYLKTLRIPLIRGRFFDDGDTPKSSNVAVVDDNLVREYFSGEDPIGKRLTIQAGKDYSFELLIVGVVGHVKQENLDTQTGSIFDTQIYTPFSQIPDNLVPVAARDMNFVVRTGPDPQNYVSAIRSTLGEVAPGQVMYGYSSMETLVSNSISDRRFVLIVLGVFSVLSLILASIGIYGVIAYSVAQRKHEIGVRLALGASRSQVLALVLGQGAKLVLAGIGLGAGGALVLTRFMQAYLFKVSPTDPTVFASISLVLAVVALAASVLPARRAMVVDPMATLRYE